MSDTPSGELAMSQLLAELRKRDNDIASLTTTNKKLQSVADAARELEDYYGCDYALEAHVSDPNGDFTPCGNCRGCRVRLALAALKEEEG